MNLLSDNGANCLQATASTYKYFWNEQDGTIHALSTLPAHLRRLQIPFCLVDNKGERQIALGGVISSNVNISDSCHKPLLGIALPQTINALGDPLFCQDYQIQYPYMAGSMANGIASVELVEALAAAGMLASFGAAGLSLLEIEQAIGRLHNTVGDKPYCFNLIYSPNEAGHEEKVVDLYIKHAVTLVEASAYMKLTQALVRYRVHGIKTDPEGNIIAPNRIIAKASRVEVANQWFSPPPEKLLTQLVTQGSITIAQATLASQIPMAQDLTVEADSGGHTDNRPALTLLPTMLVLRDRYQDRYQYQSRLRVGAAGGIATPAAALSAFTMGAAYIVTGTVNQACQESGSSAIVRTMLAEAEQADVAMAPAVDMFEMGVKLQVLKRGTMFAMRANRLYELYTQYNGIDDLSQTKKEKLEKTVFKMPLSAVWHEIETFFGERDPIQLEKAKHDPKHKLALICRWYLGLSSRWANHGVDDRKIDYQIWCGPAMGAFNEWTRTTFLATPARRDVVTVAMNILHGAAVLNRIHTLKQQALGLPPELLRYEPLPLAEIQQYLAT